MLNILLFTFDGSQLFLWAKTIFLYQFFVPKVNNNVNRHQLLSWLPWTEETVYKMVERFGARLEPECNAE
jgi:hypothetical protein